MEKLLLTRLAKVSGGTVPEEREITAVCTDTRKLTPGCLFIAIEGDTFDGHGFVRQAAEQGAAAVMCHKPVDCGLPVLQVEDTRKAFLAIAGYYRSLFRIPVVGLTGSVGKTTTKEMVSVVLASQYKTLKTQGNFNNDIGMPHTLFGLDHTYEAAVIEMGMNHFGEIAALTKQCRPTIGLITNIGVSHIENLGSRAGILKAKLELLEGMDADAPLILNADDEMLRTADLGGRKAVWFGIDADDIDYKAVSITQTDEQTSFTIICPDGAEFAVEIPTVGRHNVLNALAGFAAGIAAGVPASKAAVALANYQPAGMRQNIVKKQTYTVIEDCYNASPDSMRAAIDTLCSMQAERRIAVLSDMLELGSYAQQAHEEVGTYAAEKGADLLLACGEAAKGYVDGAKASGLQDAYYYPDKETLLDALEQAVQQGSAVLFKASRGMKLEDVIKGLYERKDTQ